MEASATLYDPEGNPIAVDPMKPQALYYEGTPVGRLDLSILYEVVASSEEIDLSTLNVTVTVKVQLYHFSSVEIQNAQKTGEAPTPTVLEDRVLFEKSYQHESVRVNITLKPSDLVLPHEDVLMPNDLLSLAVFVQVSASARDIYGVPRGASISPLTTEWSFDWIEETDQGSTEEPAPNPSAEESGEPDLNDYTLGYSWGYSNGTADGANAALKDTTRYGTYFNQWDDLLNQHVQKLQAAGMSDALINGFKAGYQEGFMDSYEKWWSVLHEEYPGYVAPRPGQPVPLSVVSGVFSPFEAAKYFDAQRFTIVATLGTVAVLGSVFLLSRFGLI